MSVDSTSAILLSLEVASASTLLSVVPAVGIGRWLARTRSPWKVVVNALVLVPMVLPPVVTGLLLLDVFGRTTLIGGLLGQFGLPLSFSWAGAVLAAAVVGFPLFAISVRQAFEAVDPQYEQLAASLGSSRAATFFRVSLPLAWPGIGAGAILSFARSLGEFGATAVFAANREGETRTIALAVYTLLDKPGRDPAIGGLVAASLALSVLSLVCYEVLNRRARA